MTTVIIILFQCPTGWFRQCSIIPYSKDIDIGIQIKYYKPELIQAFVKGGFFLKNIFGKVKGFWNFIISTLKLGSVTLLLK